MTARANRCGVAAVEKVILLSGIIGLMSFATLFLEQLCDTHRLSTALTGDVSAYSLGNLQNRIGQDRDLGNASPGSPALLTSSQSPVSWPKSVRWLIGLSLPTLAVIAALFVLRGNSAAKKPAPKPNEFVEIKRKLESTLAPGNAFTKRQQIMAMLLNRVGFEAFGDIRIGQLVSPKVTTVLPSTPLDEIRKFFLDHHFRHLFVCDIMGNLHGIISARDLQRSQTGTAVDIMSTEIVTANHDQLISPTITLMLDRRISCLPVVDNDRLLGIVTTTDLMIALQCTLQILQTLGNNDGSAQRQDRSEFAKTSKQ